jgi:hypothetical protein
MARSRTYYPNLSRALPAGNPLAELAARALVLYGDLNFEWHGVREDDGFQGLATLGDGHRRLYFFRASTVTLYSCVKLLNELWKNEEYQNMLDGDADAKAKFRASKKDLDRHSALICRLRNAVGGHMEQGVGDATARFSPDEVGAFEFHTTDGVRPHLATAILIHAIVQNRPDDSMAAQEEQFVRIAEDIKAATVAMIRALTDFLSKYGTRYPLFKG